MFVCRRPGGSVVQGGACLGMFRYLEAVEAGFGIASGGEKRDNRVVEPFGVCEWVHRT